MTSDPATYAAHDGPAGAGERVLKTRLEELERQFETMWSLVSPEKLKSQAGLGVGRDTAGIAEVRKVILARRLRSRFFSSALFGEPAWDMLLELYAASLAQQRISVSGLARASGTAVTTALRWIAMLEQEGLLSRRNDPLDGRRVFLELTEAGREAMRGYFHERNGTSK